MKKLYLMLVALITLGFSAAHAEIEIWEDYEPSEEVYLLTTVKVDSNMGEVYLEGLMNTWVPGVEIEKKLGHIKDYAIYYSDMPENGDFNVVLKVVFENSAAMAPNKERYKKMMAEFTKKRADESTEFARKEYPSIRTITGSYPLRKVKILK